MREAQIVERSRGRRIGRGDRLILADGVLNLSLLVKRDAQRQPRRFSELRSACVRASMRGWSSKGSARMTVVGDSTRSCSPCSSR